MHARLRGFVLDRITGMDGWKKNLLKKERNVMARSASVLRLFFPVVDCRERAWRGAWLQHTVSLRKMGIIYYVRKSCKKPVNYVKINPSINLPPLALSHGTWESDCARSVTSNVLIRTLFSKGWTVCTEVLCCINRNGLGKGRITSLYFKLLLA